MCPRKVGGHAIATQLYCFPPDGAERARCLVSDHDRGARSEITAALSHEIGVVISMGLLSRLQVDSLYFFGVSVLLTMLLFGRTAAYLLAGAAVVAAGYPRVNFQNGSIKGKALTVSNATANAYLGIAFAKPPTKFLAPEAPDAISGEYDGTTWKSSCMQTGTVSVKIPPREIVL